MKWLHIIRDLKVLFVKDGNNYVSKGIYELQYNKIIIKELPMVCGQIIIKII